MKLDLDQIVDNIFAFVGAFTLWGWPAALIAVAFVNSIHCIGKRIERHLE